MKLTNEVIDQLIMEELGRLNEDKIPSDSDGIRNWRKIATGSQAGAKGISNDRQKQKDFKKGSFD